MEMTGAEIIVRCLAEQGVKHVFGYPGGAVLYIYDAIFNQKDFQHVLVRHEQAAVHAADAYSRSSDQVGVCLVTSGPGLTNAVTGIATAYMDSIPMVVISGQVNSRAIGEDAFQECDAVGITRHCVKHNFLVRHVKDLADTMRNAFYIAKTGRPGPVLVDVPKDVSMHRYPYHPPRGPVTMRSYAPVVKGHMGQIKKAAQALRSAKRPIIYAGGGVVGSNASGELARLAELLKAPCTTTLMALGAMPADHPQYLGMPGMHGTYEANMALQHSDVVVGVGTRFDDRVISNPKHFSQTHRRIIHIDVDPSSISKRVRADIPIVGDVKSVLTDLNDYLQSSSAENLDADHCRQDWWAQIDQWRARDSLAYKGADSSPIKPQFVIQKLCEYTRGEAFITSDVGQHQMWAAQYYHFRHPKRWINSGGLGTMGVGLPYAMGVQMANPGAPVAVVTGEGSIQMNIQELATCRQYGFTPKIFCLNNRYLGMVRQWQELEYESRYSESYMDSIPDFVKLVESYGHVGMRLDKVEEVEPAIHEAFTTHRDRLVFLDIQTDRNANVWPMVQAGKGLTDMLIDGKAV